MLCQEWLSHHMRIAAGCQMRLTAFCLLSDRDSMVLQLSKEYGKPRVTQAVIRSGAKNCADCHYEIASAYSTIVDAMFESEVLEE